MGVVIMPRVFNQPREVPIIRAPSTREGVRAAFGKRLAAARVTAGYPDRVSIARAMGIEPSTYGRWERGETEPAYADLLRLCGLLNTDPNFLLIGLKSKV